PWVNGNLYDEFGTNVRKDNIAIPPLNQLRLYSVRSLPGSWVNRLDGTELFNTGSNTVSFSATPQLGINAASNYYDGLIPEVVFYSQALNTAQRNIVENYLAAKYNINIANDFYNFDLTHGNEVAGIGQVDASNFHSAAESAGILKISSPSAMGNGEYLLFGHDNTSITAWNTTEIPASSTNIQRLTREWIANETGDLGNVTIGINSTLLPALPSQYSTYVLMVDADGDFTSSAVLYPMTNIAANQYEAVGINLANQSRLAIAIVRPLIQYTVSSSQSLEPTSPGVLTVQLNYPLERNVTVNYAVTGGSAIGGVDYVFANGTLTIPAGSTSSVQNITLINDILVEADETIIVQLSSPSTGVTLGAIDTHTFTINDDDNLRKVSFAPPVASSGAESVGTVVLTVLTSLVDASNPTTVDYSITGGTATSGVDAIASGTLTIPAGQPSATFNLSIIDDAINEANETVIITLTNPTNSNLNTTNTTYTYTIDDDDVAPTVQFNNSTAIGAEPVVNALIQVSLSATSGQNVVVNYTVTPGTATSGVDYSLPSGSVTIPAGSSSVNIVAVVLDDVLIEGGEDFTVTITGATGATLGATLVNAVIISDNDNDGFTGPGGVGDATVMRFWLKASALTGFVDGQTVSSWTDFSGNSVSINAVNSPSYKLVGINSIPAIEFKASESDYYTLPSQSSLSQGEIFVVTMINNDPPSAGSSGLWHLGNSSSTHYPWTNGNLYDEFGTNVRKDNIPINPLNVPRIYNVRSQPNSWVSRLDGVNIFTTASNTVSFQASAKLGANAAPNYFDGLMPEVVLFNVGLNTAKRTIIENYLAAKYNTTIAVDKYQYQATHSSDVIGIGRDDALNLHIQSQSAGILTVGSPTNLGDGEYLMTGHDNGSIASWNSTNVPNTAFQRLARAWRVDETGGDVGSVVLTINKSSFPALPAGFDNYAVLVDNDGNFASGANILTPTFIDANNFQVTLNLTTGDFIAIAVVQNVTAQAGVFSTASTWTAGTVPLTGQNVIINHAVSLTSNASVGAMAIGATGSLSLGTSTLDITNGNLTIGVGGSLIANTGTVNYSQAGNQCVAPATYYNLTLSGTGIKTLCGNVSVGNTINFGSVVTLNTDVANNYSINLAGSWTGIGIFVPNTSTVTINGTALQTLNVSGLTFYNLVVNKPSADLQISSSITVTNAVTLTQGDIVLGGQNLVLGNSATISAGSVNSYVQATGAGAIRKNFASTGSTMSFPVGDATLLTPLSINFASATLSSAYVAVNLRNIKHPSVPNAGINRYWIVTPNGITSPTYTIIYTYDQSDVLVGGDEVVYRPVKFDGSLQSGTATDLDETTNTVTWVGLNSFSDFTVESNAPLPVELIRFSGYFDNGENILEWVTATELNNSHFEVQRSGDGVEFEKIGKVDGAGTTNLQQDYLFIDRNPHSGKNYYQLKQVDFDTKFSYSKTILVDANSVPQLSVTVSPNPAIGDRVTATVRGTLSGKPASITVTDLNGKTIVSASFTPTQAQNKIEFESSYLASGFYVVTVAQGIQVAKTKLIVAK
ncbi:MAG: T9SS type A sorting domain-containing protein, partial [Microcystis sp. M137S2]|nr:T9SS type A sorting domain-containing protein [Microcystis sp. M087S2]MCA2753188.1 T9SS type A sorting domain-containing protein [Microcystis sp. M137S2]